jgi:hypothetical protein
MTSIQKLASTINETDDGSRDSWSQPAMIDQEDAKEDRMKPRTLQTKSTFEDLGTLSEADYDNDDAKTTQDNEYMEFKMMRSRKLSQNKIMSFFLK